MALPTVVAALAEPRILDRPVQLHGFFSQGFMLSDGNNYLGTQTGQGTFSPTDAGLNGSVRITDRLRAGAQLYSRKVGNLGHGHVKLDWGFADYRFHDSFGIRAGKVKTVFGLYNDTQDMEFLHTWALLPQSLYPLDLRGLSVAHTGVNFYGTVPARRAGSFAYTVFSGRSPRDLDGGRVYGIESAGLRVTRATGTLAGADVKWTTPISGLLLGAARMSAPNHFFGDNERFGGSFEIHSGSVKNTTLSAQYQRGGLRLDFERSRVVSYSKAVNPFGSFGPAVVPLPYDSRAWYGAAAYRFNKWFEAGSYHSRYSPNANRPSPGGASRPEELHVHDHAVAARFDFRDHWDLKVEGHHMDGYGEPGTTRGFYPRDNPRGLKPKTLLLVIRLGFYW